MFQRRRGARVPNGNAQRLQRCIQRPPCSARGKHAYTSNCIVYTHAIYNCFCSTPWRNNYTKWVRFKLHKDCLARQAGAPAKWSWSWARRWRCTRVPKGASSAVTGPPQNTVLMYPPAVTRTSMLPSSRSLQTDRPSVSRSRADSRVAPSRIAVRSSWGHPAVVAACAETGLQLKPHQG